MEFMAYWLLLTSQNHDDVIKWKHFPVTGRLCGEFTGHRWIPRTKASDVEIWFSLIYAWIHGLVKNGEAGDLRRHRAHYDAIVMDSSLCVRGGHQAYFLKPITLWALVMDYNQLKSLYLYLAILPEAFRIDVYFIYSWKDQWRH